MKNSVEYSCSTIIEGHSMFTVKKTEYINKTFRIPKELSLKLEELAQEKNVSVNNLVIQCCEYALNSTKEPDGV